MSHMRKLRKHQEEAVKRAQAIARGDKDIEGKVTVASVTPGGGKTRMAAGFANELKARGFIDQVIILVPNDALRRQMRDGFTDPEAGFVIRLGSDSAHDLRQTQCFDRGGVVTTYQANIRNVKRLLKRFSGKRVLLILDEPHHLSDADKAQWKLAVAPLFEMARHVLLMTGTINRHDETRIAFVPYGADDKPIVHISYSRREALIEHAILRVSVKLCDSSTKYWHKYQKHSVELSAATKDQQSRALDAALEDPQYREHVLEDAVREWQEYRQRMYGSRAIVICHTQGHARAAASFLRTRFGLRSTLAISSEPDASDGLRRFRERSGDAGDVLVTCQMAYEGLDVPDCTHLVCLTNIRSAPWLDQALARVTRVNHGCSLPWSQQIAFIYVPKDPEMTSYLDAALDDQQLLAVGEDEGEHAGAPAPAPRRSTYAPIEGVPGAKGYADIEGCYDDSANRLVERVKKELPNFASHPAYDLLQLAKLIWPTEVLAPGGAV
jgi:superfamily II DNA or RNA helicase